MPPACWLPYWPQLVCGVTSDGDAVVSPEAVSSPDPGSPCVCARLEVGALLMESS